MLEVERTLALLEGQLKEAREERSRSQKRFETLLIAVYRFFETKADESSLEKLRTTFDAMKYPGN